MWRLKGRVWTHVMKSAAEVQKKGRNVAGLVDID